MHENSKNIHSIFFSIIRESKLDVSLISPNLKPTLFCSKFGLHYYCLEGLVGLPKQLMVSVCAVNPGHAINLYRGSNQLGAKSSNSNVVGPQIV